MDTGQLREVMVDSDDASLRLDRVLALRIADLSRSRLKALIVDGQVTIAGQPVRDPAYHVRTGQTIVIDVPPAAPAEPVYRSLPPGQRTIGRPKQPPRLSKHKLLKRSKRQYDKHWETSEKPMHL